MAVVDTIVILVGKYPPPPPRGELPDIPYGGEPIPPVVIETPTPIFPNVITPNEDGINDYFTIQDGELFTQIELTILNRWGNVVYYNNDYKNDFGGRLDVSDGVYFYVANLYFEPTDVYLTYTGDLTINK